MSEFSTSATVEISPDPKSLKRTRDTIESEIGAVEVAVSPSGDLGGGGGPRIAGRERAMQRSLTSHGLDLDEERNELAIERNELLKQLVESQEQNSFDRAMRGGAGGLGMGLAGIGLIGAGLAAVGGTLSNFELPKLSPGDVVDDVALAASDLIATAASITATDVISRPLSLTAADVIGTAATITAGSLVATAATIPASALIATGATIAAGDLISQPLSLAPEDLVDSAADIAADHVVDAALVLTPSMLIATKVAPEIADFIDSKINLTAEDVLAALGLSGVAAGLSNGLPKGVGSGFGTGFGFPSPGSFLAGWAQDAQTTDASKRGPIDRFLSDLVSGMSPRGSSTPRAAMTAETQTVSTVNGAKAARKNETTIEYSPTYNLDTSRLERQQRQERREIERRLSNLEQAFQSPR